MTAGQLTGVTLRQAGDRLFPQPPSTTIFSLTVPSVCKLVVRVKVVVFIIWGCTSSLDIAVDSSWLLRLEKPAGSVHISPMGRNSHAIVLFLIRYSCS